MALGAGFKLNGKDKERDKSKEKEKDEEKKDKRKEKDKEKEREKDRDSQSDEPRAGRSHEVEKVKDEDDRRRSRHISLLRHAHQHQRSEEDDFMANASASAHDLLASLHHPYGWTSMLEDWFCNGEHAPTPMHPSAHDDHEPSANLEDVPLSPKARSTGDLNSRMQSMQKGPYELLTKERMMGLYLAVFIRRDCRELVRGAQ